MLNLIRPLRYLWSACVNERTPKQLSWGLALGFLLGMVPKGSFVALLFGTVLFATRVNLGLGLLTALVVAAISPIFDPLTHQLGLRLLHHPGVGQWLSAVYEYPLAPWLALHNTVTLGSTVLGLALVWPVQHLAEKLAVILFPPGAEQPLTASPPNAPKTHQPHRTHQTDVSHGTSVGEASAVASRNMKLVPTIQPQGWEV